MKHKYKRYSEINLPSALNERNGRRSLSKIATSNKNDISQATSDQIGYETKIKKNVKFDSQIDLTAIVATSKIKS